MDKPPVPLSRQFLAFLWPVMLSNLVQAISSTASGIYIGNLLGMEAYAAVAVFAPPMMLVSSFVIGTGTGASVLAGHALGASDSDRLRAVGHTALCFAVVLGMVAAVTGFIFAESLINVLATPVEIRVQARVYVQAMMPVLPLQFVLIAAVSLLRGTGDARTPLCTSTVTSLGTLIATPLLIERLGIAGAAAGLFIAHSAALLWIFMALRGSQHALTPMFVGRWKVSASLLFKQIKLGYPMSLFFIAGSLADIGLLRLVNLHGPSATAAWGAVRQIMTYVQFSAASIAIATSVLAAQAIGARNRARLEAVPRVALRLNLLTTGITAAVASLLAPLLVGLFLADLRAIHIGTDALRVLVLGSIFFGAASILTSTMRASGKVLIPTGISLGCIVLLLNPIASFLHGPVGLLGIWIAYPVTYFCAAAMQWMYFTRIHRRSPAQKYV